MLWLYRLLFVPLLVVASPYYLLRMKRRGGYSRHFSQRLGATPELPPRGKDVTRIWLQAVSVGEMLAIAPIIEAFQENDAVQIYLTTTTSTGYGVAREKYRDKVAGIGYFPLDWWWLSARAWRRICPDLVILTEGERWPEHIHQAARRSIPVICLNARLSDRSYARMKTWRWAIMPVLKGLTHILACSEHDAERFKDLGFDAAKITTIGNIKLDLRIEPLDPTRTRALRAELGFGDEPILLGSSTWPGEEAAMLAAYEAVRAAGLSAKLLLVPRHAERRHEVETVVSQSKHTYHFRSRGAAPGPVDVCIADTTGELRMLTQLAEIVFVGKSLPPHDQGQSPVEAAASGKPVLFGPGMTNFRPIARDLVEAGAAKVVNTPEKLASVMVTLLKDGPRREGMSSAAQGWHRTNRGAVARTLELLHGEIQRSRARET
jgi:3-deoxy-D-manno-octulosonic-acid transferase